MRIGYKASGEQFGPAELLDLGARADALGFDSIAVSDHVQPWRHDGGHGVEAVAWLGALTQRTERAAIGTSVLAPILRRHPAAVAQAFGTLASLAPGRVFLGVGTGEALNEVAPTGAELPSLPERRARLEEAVGLIRRLWREERVDHAGEHFATRALTIYDRPVEPVPILLAAGGPLAAALAGRVGDGMICTSGKPVEGTVALLEAAAAGAEGVGRDPASLEHVIEVKVSYDADRARAEAACAPWAALALSPEAKRDVADPRELERRAATVLDRASDRFIVSDDPGEVIERVAAIAELGFGHLLLHTPGDDQGQALEALAADVLPGLRARFRGGGSK